MNTYQYTVIVEAETEDQADQVMVERVMHDEDYGFPYSVKLAVRDTRNFHIVRS